jgi:hypothetical protein
MPVLLSVSIRYSNNVKEYHENHRYSNYYYDYNKPGFHGLERRVREYLVELVTKQMISYNDTTRTYKATRQGLEFLRLYEAMKKL